MSEAIYQPILVETMLNSFCFNSFSFDSCQLLILWIRDKCSYKHWIHTHKQSSDLASFGNCDGTTTTTKTAVPIAKSIEAFTQWTLRNQSHPYFFSFCTANWFKIWPWMGTSDKSIILMRSHVGCGPFTFLSYVDLVFIWYLIVISYFENAPNIYIANTRTEIISVVILACRSSICMQHRHPRALVSVTTHDAWFDRGACAPATWRRGQGAFQGDAAHLSAPDPA